MSTIGGRLLSCLFILEWIPLGFLHFSPSLEYLNHSCLLKAGLLPEIMALLARASVVASSSSGLALTTYCPAAASTTSEAASSAGASSTSASASAAFHPLTVLGPTPDRDLMTSLTFSSSLIASASSATLLMPMAFSSSTFLSFRPWRSVSAFTVILSPCAISGRCRFRPGTSSCRIRAWMWPSRGWRRSGRRPRCRCPPP